MPFKSMKQLREKNQEIGEHFFDDDVMKFWDRKIESRFFQGTFFITSDKAASSKEKRKFTIRRALDSGSIMIEGRPNGHSTLEDAKDAARELVKRL